MINFRELVKAGVHFGHQKTRWCPKMAPYIWGIKNNIHLIDVSKTAFQMEKAARFLQSVASEGKQILWIGTKKSAKDAINQAGLETEMPYVSHRWIGGTLSNFAQVKKSVTKCLHFEDIISKTEKLSHYTKKELNTYQKIAGRLEKNIGGIKKLTWPIGAIVVVDVFKEQSAVKEAVNMGIPVVALVDTNCDPTMIDYVIPTNDDAPRAISLIINYLIEAVKEGKAAIKQTRKEKIEESIDEDGKKGSAKKAEKSADKKEVKNNIEAKPQEEDIDSEDDDAIVEKKSNAIRKKAKADVEAEEDLEEYE